MELTHDEIRRASTAKLRKILKEDIDVELDDMIDEITAASGWLIKNIYYEIQLK